MKKLIFLLLVFAGFMACENESIEELPQETSVTEGMTAKQSDKIDVCHYDAENDSWHVINISANAWKGHEKHGDVLLVDADGDGWVSYANECVPGGDCDDANYDVNPGVKEVCDNGIDDNCNGEIDEGCDFTVKILQHCDANSTLLDTAVGQGYHALTTSGESYLVLGADVTSVIMTHNNGSTATIYNDANLCAFYNGIWFNDQLYAIEIF